ncbi:hypothetical protein ACWGLC_15970 [Dietzia sp. NPDC055877]
MSRFNFFPIFIGLWRGLSGPGTSGGAGPADWVARAILVVPPIAALVLFAVLDGSVAAPGAVLSGLALLSGTLLAVYAQLAGLRLRLTDREYPTYRETMLKDSLDENVAHILAAVLIGLANCVVIVTGMSAMGSDGERVLTGYPAAVVAGLGLFEMLILLMTVTSLYSAYTSSNDVHESLDGHQAR